MDLLSSVEGRSSADAVPLPSHSQPLDGHQSLPFTLGMLCAIGDVSSLLTEWEDMVPLRDTVDLTVPWWLLALQVGFQPFISLVEV